MSTIVDIKLILKSSKVLTVLAEYECKYFNQNNGVIYN
jgi:hypothetical protein